MRIFSESPLDRRDHANRLSCHIIHEFRFSRIDFCSAARCRQRAGESGFYDPPRAFTGISRVHSTATVARTVPSLGASYCTRIFVSRASAFARLRKVPARGRKRLLRPTSCLHGNLPHPLDRHGRAHRALARRIILHANLRLLRVGFRPAVRRRQCARICRRKEARRASVQAKTTSTTRPALSR